MSFKRRLLLVVIGLLTLILCVNLMVSIYKSRSYVSEQMSVLSQDAATSLGFAISTASRDDGNVQASSMVDVVFDSGYYLNVSYFDVDGNMVVSRARQLDLDGVPGWFVDLMHVPLSIGKAEVVSGWFRLGQVHVIAHPGYAYRELWRLVLDYSMLFLFSIVLAYGVIGLLLGSITKPLYRLERQVRAVSELRFVEEAELPKSGEFRRLVLAVNTMVRKLKQSFDNQLALVHTLRDDAHTDTLTQLPNRAEFDARLDAWLSSDEGHGPSLLMLVSLRSLNTLNDLYGRSVADQLLSDMATVLNTFVDKGQHRLAGRRTGTDFAIYMPGIFPDEAKDVVHDVYTALVAEMHKLSAHVSFESELSFAMGAALTTRGGEGLHLLQAADRSLRQSLSSNSLPGVIDVHDHNIDYRSASEWRPILQDAIEQGALIPFFQPVFTADGVSLDHYELLCRIQDETGYCDAGVFWPLVERFGLSQSVDKAMLQYALDLLEARDDINLHVNLSLASLRYAEFIDWLNVYFTQCSPSCLQRLSVEVPESIFLNVESLVKPLLTVTNAYAIDVVIDRFGMLPTALAHTQALGIRYVKLDRRFVSNIADSAENRFYVQSLIGICQVHDIVFACEGLERQEDMAALVSLGASRFQGFLLGEPVKNVL